MKFVSCTYCESLVPLGSEECPNCGRPRTVGRYFTTRWGHLAPSNPYVNWYLAMGVIFGTPLLLEVFWMVRNQSRINLAWALPGLMCHFSVLIPVVALTEAYRAASRRRDYMGDDYMGYESTSRPRRHRPILKTLIGRLRSGRSRK